MLYSAGIYVPPVSRLVYVSGGSAALSAADAKSHARVSGTGEDTLIGDYCLAAQRYIEDQTGLILSTATWRLHLDHFPDVEAIEIPKGPLAAVTSITYVDADGDAQTFASANYRALTGTIPGRVELVDGASWPSDAASDYAAVAVNVTLGYSSLPDLWKLALRILVAHWIENREAVGNAEGFLAQIIRSGAVRSRLEGVYAR